MRGREERRVPGGRKRREGYFVLYMAFTASPCILRDGGDVSLNEWLYYRTGGDTFTTSLYNEPMVKGGANAGSLL